MALFRDENFYANKSLGAREIASTELLRGMLYVRVCSSLLFMISHNLKIFMLLWEISMIAAKDEFIKSNQKFGFDIKFKITELLLHKVYHKIFPTVYSIPHYMILEKLPSLHVFHLPPATFSQLFQLTSIYKISFSNYKSHKKTSNN